MTRREYFRRLRKALGKIPESDKDSLIEYYSEMVEEALDRGKSEEEFFASLDAPEQVAKDYLASRTDLYGGSEDFGSPPKREKKRRKPPRENAEGSEKRRGGILRNPLVLVLLFPFALVALVLALAALIVCIALVIADVALTVGLCAGGIYAVVMSFGLLFSHNVLIALMQIGIGIALFGIAMLFELTLRPLFRGIYLLVCLAFHRQARPARGGEAVKSRVRVRTAVCAVVMLFAGGVLGAASAGGLGWDYHRFADVGDFVETEQTLVLEENFTFVGQNLGLEIHSAEGDEARFVYYRNDTIGCVSDYADGTLTVEGESDWRNNFRDVWKCGIFYSAVASAYNHGRLYLPKEYAGVVSISVGNGAVSIERLDCEGLAVETDNGAVKIDTCTFGDLSVRAKNGAVKIEDVTANSVNVEARNGLVSAEDVAAKTMRLETRNGAVRIDEIQADDITLIAANGAVRGTLKGRKTDYKITVECGNGSCNLSNTQTGEKVLNVSTRNGSVKITFDD